MATYMTAYDVARELKVSRVAASRVMVLAGAVDIGCGEKRKVLRITEAALQAYLATRKTEPPRRVPNPNYWMKQQNRKLKKGEVRYPELERRKYDV